MKFVLFSRKTDIENRDFIERSDVLEISEKKRVVGIVKCPVLRVFTWIDSEGTSRNETEKIPDEKPLVKFDSLGKKQKKQKKQ